MIRQTPELPSIARKPLAWIPLPIKAKAITGAMNAMFVKLLEAGELEFLAERVMNVIVSDAELRFSVRLDQNKLRAGVEASEADLTIEGTVYTFLLLATRKEDADTLFFRRQLKTSGDTELGLYVKNFLDGLEPETLPYHRTIDAVLRKSLAVADRVDKFRSS
ncbi:MAG: sterol-binding protein [Woeseiaceae bacterium]|nr:sterol-binding protein [Woeseiaceae bacterium]